MPTLTETVSNLGRQDKAIFGVIILVVALLFLTGSGAVRTNPDKTYKADVSVSLYNQPFVDTTINVDQPQNFEKEGFLSQGRLVTGGITDGFIPSDEVDVTVSIICDNKVRDKTSFTETVQETGQGVSKIVSLGNIPAGEECKVQGITGQGKKDEATFTAPQ